jgi:hypothetical protein
MGFVVGKGRCLNKRLIISGAKMDQQDLLDLDPISFSNTLKRFDYTVRRIRIQDFLSQLSKLVSIILYIHIPIFHYKITII